MAEKKEYFIKIENQQIQVSETVYRTYYGLQRRDKTLEEKDQRNGRMLYSNLDTSETLGEEMIPDMSAAAVEDMVIAKLMLERLHRCINLLPKGELELIQAIYFDQLSERKLSKKMGIHYMTLHDRKIRILQKLRKMMEDK